MLFYSRLVAFASAIVFVSLTPLAQAQDNSASLNLDTPNLLTNVPMLDGTDNSHQKLAVSQQDSKPTANHTDTKQATASTEAASNNQKTDDSHSRDERNAKNSQKDKKSAEHVKKTDEKVEETAADAKKTDEKSEEKASEDKANANEEKTKDNEKSETTNSSEDDLLSSEMSGESSAEETAETADAASPEETAAAQAKEQVQGQPQVVLRKFKHFYVMLQGGWGTQDINSGVQRIFGIEVLGVSSRVKSGIAGGAHFGIRVNPYAGFEVGFMKYSDASLQQTVLVFQNQSGVAKSYDFDALVTLTLPLEHGLFVFAKGGAALVHTKFTVPGILENFQNNNSAPTDDGQGIIIIPRTFTKSRTALRPELGLGLGAYFTHYLSAEVAYYKIFEQQGTLQESYMPELNFFGVGLRYNF